MPECQKIKKGELDQYVAECFGIETFCHNYKNCETERVKVQFCQSFTFSHAVKHEYLKLLPSLQKHQTFLFLVTVFQCTVCLLVDVACPLQVALLVHRQLKLCITQPHLQQLPSHYYSSAAHNAINRHYNTEWPIFLQLSIHRVWQSKMETLIS